MLSITYILFLFFTVEEIDMYDVSHVNCYNLRGCAMVNRKKLLNMMYLLSIMTFGCELAAGTVLSWPPEWSPVMTVAKNY